eukprot:TRINITY_DN76686_c0_g1_i1.p1 TRINITY_DN76686_c0_g1~~TRINITY_DN76686_c0_g1_i1.p1  ORF type:complete len:1222 (+),score=210.17 TRINITY_DN76686_c0_g1_i1:285-3668(+)
MSCASTPVVRLSSAQQIQQMPTQVLTAPCKAVVATMKPAQVGSITPLSQLTPEPLNTQQLNVQAPAAPESSHPAPTGEDPLQSDMLMPSLRSLRSSASQAGSSAGGYGAKGVQGVANCILCHALLQEFAGKIRIQTFTTASLLPAPPQEMVDRALALELSEEEEIMASSSLCRFYSLHKRRYELWLKGQGAIRRCTTRGESRATSVIRQTAQELAKIESMISKAEPEFIEAFSLYLKKLQQDVRENLFKILMGKVGEEVQKKQKEMDEDDEKIAKAYKEKRLSMSEAMDRCQESSRELYWRHEQKQAAQRFVGCLVDNCKNLQTCKSSTAAHAFKELALTEQAKRVMTARHVESQVAKRTEKEAAKRERQMSIWLSKMDQLQMLQHFQASKDKESLYLNVAMTVRRLEEDQCIEHRQITSRISQHVVQMRSLLEKILRSQGVCMGSDMYNVSPGSIVLQSESFLHLVLRAERAAAIDGSSTLSPRRSGSTANLSAHVEASRQEWCGDEFASPTAQSGATFTTGQLTESGDSAVSMELTAFGEFLGSRFPCLRAAVASMDLTGTGRIACFELESWLRQQMYPGDARMLLKDLGRKGSLGLGSFKLLVPSFIHSSLVCGRPGGTSAAALMQLFWNCSERKLRRMQPFEAHQAAVRCCRRVGSFLSADVSADQEEEPMEWPEMELSPKSARCGDSQVLGTYSSASVSSNRGLATSQLLQGEPSLAEIAARSRLWNSADSRLSDMHYRASVSRSQSRDKSLPRHLRPANAKTALSTVVAAERRMAPPPKCISSLQGRSAKQQAAHQLRSLTPRQMKGARTIQTAPHLSAPAHSPPVQSAPHLDQPGDGRPSVLTEPCVGAAEQKGVSPRQVHSPTSLVQNTGSQGGYPQPAKGATRTGLTPCQSTEQLQNLTMKPQMPVHRIVVRSPSAPALARTPGVPSPRTQLTYAAVATAGGGAVTPGALSSSASIRTEAYVIPLAPPMDHRHAYPATAPVLSESAGRDGSLTPKLTSASATLLLPTAPTPPPAPVPALALSHLRAAVQSEVSAVSITPGRSPVGSQQMPAAPLPTAPIPRAATPTSTSPRVFMVPGSAPLPQRASPPARSGTPVVSHAVSALHRDRSQSIAPAPEEH